MMIKPPVRIAALPLLALAIGSPPSPLAAQVGTTLPILDAATLRASCEYTLQDARARAAELERLPLEQASVATVLMRWNEDSVVRENVIGPIAILNNVHPDRRVRDAAEACLQQFSGFNTELYQNEALYQRVNAVATHDPVEAKVRSDLLQFFEDTGVNLPPEQRARAGDITDRLTELRQEFERNLRDDTTRLVFTPEEYRGVPASYVERVQKDEGGNITVGMDSPDYVPFMRNALNADARRRYYIAYLNVGAPRNLEILEEIATLRRELAALHGQPSFAHHVIRRQMATTPEQVLGFLDEVATTVSEAEERELEDIRAVKAQFSGQPLDQTTLDQWDLGFYRERLREQRYAVDQEELRSFFPSEPTLNWVLDMSAQLYGVTFAEAEVPVWHPDVRYFDVTDDATGEFVGGLYVDIYPREGKYGHAAVWPTRRSTTLLDRRPISVLVTNFDRRGLTQAELETLLHELGHALHNIFSQTRYNLHAGTAVERDFVEAPSQMYEEWARRPETLATIPQSCPECPILTAEQVERLNAARNFGLGIRYAEQRMLAAFDMALAGPEPIVVMRAWRSLEEQRVLTSVPETHFPARFTHVANHYGAGYYGYMWSEVIALDLLSAFGENLMDPAVGARFREIVLSRGAERPTGELVEEFLGRPVNRDAFFAEIQGERVR